MKACRATLPFFLAATASAYTSGAGGCAGGTPAVNGLHVSGLLPVTQTDLTEAGFEVTIDNVGIVPGEGFQVQPGVAHTLTVQAIDEEIFRGALLRVEQGDGSSLTLTPDSFSQNAGACVTPVLGVTHTDSSEKTRLGGVLRTESTEPITLDVTIVEQNSQGGSVFSYDQYSIEVRGPPEETSAPTVRTSEPTNPPTPAPTTSAPVPMPTDPPMSLEPTIPPLSPDPTMAPVSANPTMVPISPEPSMPPVSPEPSVSPVSPSPVVAPVSSNPTMAPISPEPSMAPVSPEPTMATTTTTPIAPVEAPTEPANMTDAPRDTGDTPPPSMMEATTIAPTPFPTMTPTMDTGMNPGVDGQRNTTSDAPSDVPSDIPSSAPLSSAAPTSAPPTAAPTLGSTTDVPTSESVTTTTLFVSVASLIVSMVVQ